MSKPTKRKKVPISKRALIQRINRKLPAQHALLTSRSPRARAELGEHYLLTATNVEGNVDLEKMGREMGVLKPWETVTP